MTSGMRSFVPMSSSMRNTASLAPPCNGPHSEAIPAAMLANGFAWLEPTPRTVDVDAFCWRSVWTVARLFELRGDDEQNGSTSTVRGVGSSHANPFASIAAGIASLWGPLHGGANEAVLRMLLDIGTKDRIPEVIARAKDKNDPFRLFGFGHRVYKNYDPRARVMKRVYEEVLSELGVSNDPLFDLARELEKVALNDEYFISRKLYPNVDFYSGVIMHALGIPMTMFTAIFAIARTPGWLAQWKEMIEDPDQRIARPRQLYTGAPRRSYVDVKHRVSQNGAAAGKQIKAEVHET